MHGARLSTCPAQTQPATSVSKGTRAVVTIQVNLSGSGSHGDGEQPTFDRGRNLKQLLSPDALQLGPGEDQPGEKPRRDGCAGRPQP